MQKPINDIEKSAKNGQKREKTKGKRALNQNNRKKFEKPLDKIGESML